MNNVQSQQAMNADMGQAHAKQRISMAGADALRLAQAKLLGAQLETRADTIEGACETLCAEAKKKQKAYELAAAERSKQEAQLTQMMQRLEQMELDLETQAQAQQSLTAKVELARRNTHTLAAQYDRVSAVVKAEAVVQLEARTQRERRAAEVAQLRAAFQALERNYSVECGHLRQLAAEERSSALAEARKCAEREAETMHHARQVAQSLANEQSRGLKLVTALAAGKEAVTSVRTNMDERLLVNQAAATRLSEAIDNASTEEQRLQAQLAEFEAIGRAYQTLTAQYEASQSMIAQSKSQLRSDRAEVDALAVTLRDVQQAATGATQESAAVAQAAADAHQANDRAYVEVQAEGQRLREKSTQLEMVEGEVARLRIEKETKEVEVAVKRAEEEEQCRRLKEKETFLDELLALCSSVTGSVEVVSVTLAQKTAAYDQLQQSLHDKKTSLGRALAENVVSTASLEVAQKEHETAQTAHSTQTGLLLTAQESLRMYFDDKKALAERLTALQTLRSEALVRRAELASSLSPTLATNAATESKLSELAQRHDAGRVALAQGRTRLAECRASLATLAQAQEAASEQWEATLRAREVVQAETEALSVDTKKFVAALSALKERLQAKDEEIHLKQSTLERSRATVSNATETAAAIQAARSELAQRRQRRAEDSAKLQAELAAAEEAKHDAAARLAAAEREALTRELADAESRADKQRCKVSALSDALAAANAQECASAETRAAQLASATKESAACAAQRANVRRGLEADVEREQVATIRLKRQERVTEARVRKLEKAIAIVHEEAKASSQLHAETTELEKQNASRQAALAQQQEALAKEIKFLEKLNANRSAEMRALKQEIRNVEAAVNSLSLEAGLTPKSCLKSPKSVSPVPESKRVTFNSQSEVKADSQPAQKVPTKRTSTTLSNQKSKKVRKDPGSRPSRASSPKSPAKRSPTKCSPGKKSISPKSNPFMLPLIVEHGSTNVAED